MWLCTCTVRECNTIISSSWTNVTSSSIRDRVILLSSCAVLAGWVGLSHEVSGGIEQIAGSGSGDGASGFSSSEYISLPSSTNPSSHCSIENIYWNMSNRKVTNDWHTFLRTRTISDLCFLHEVASWSHMHRFHIYLVYNSLVGKADTPAMLSQISFQKTIELLLLLYGHQCRWSVNGITKH